MRGAIDQVEVQAGRSFAHQDALFGLPDTRGTGRRDVGEEHAFPNRGALTAFHVVHVENNFREAFVKDSGLDFERCLRAFEPVLQASESGLGSGGQVDAVGERNQPRARHENGKDAEEVPDANAARAHRRDFAIGGQAAQADENADQHACRDRNGESDGQSQRHHFEHAGERRAVAHD